MMAIMYQESKFDAKAKPPRTTCLCIFPGPRPSSAYGYSQALDSTWEKYKRSAGNWGADRDDFADSIDFVQGGFLKKTYRRKAWLRRVASKTAGRAKTYKKQLASCEREFQKRGDCCLWPF
jgi:hypothetical protein